MSGGALAGTVVRWGFGGGFGFDFSAEVGDGAWRPKREACSEAAVSASFWLWTMQRTSQARRCCARRLEGSVVCFVIRVWMSGLRMNVKSLRYRSMSVSAVRRKN